VARGLGHRQRGGIACLIASASYAVSYGYMDRYLALRGVDPLTLSASQLLAATGLLILASPSAV
jgi:drug/metabolite transporter (DMT)-like permease